MPELAVPKPKYDWAAGVRVRVQRASQSPYYSLFREESTRQAATVYEGRRGAAAAGTNAEPAIQDDGTRLPFFPYANDGSLRSSLAEATTVTPQTVTLIGATGTVGKFVAEQYLHRGISVTVLARDIEKARDLFLPIADGDRERRRSASLGFVSLGTAAQQPTLTDSADYADEGRDGHRVLRYAFQTTSRAASSSSPVERQVALELVEGDVASPTDLEFSMRHASAVFYLASALEEVPGLSTRQDSASTFPSSSSVSTGPWWSPTSWFVSHNRFGGFLNAFDACRRVDAHFVALTPLWVHGSRLSPIYWYRRLLCHPRGYCKAVELQERSLLGLSGHPSARCYFGKDELEAQQLGADWDYWWRIWLSTELPEDLPIHPRSPVRFSLFRLSDIVFPSFNERLVVAKNNRVDDDMHTKPIHQGDLDARLLSNVLVKSLSLCKSVVESRIDVGGRLRNGTDMRDAGAVFDLFERLRNE